ncbi:MAG: hypothetical protein J6X94_06675 [Lachnospiraceae bacterium]|nr:hypothetical protein [Lachnospiraceae bacterium]
MGRTSFLKSNRGASLVLVSIFSVIVISLALTLVAIGSMLLSDAGSVKKYNQAYELATSLSNRIEELILNETSDNLHKSRIDLDSFITDPATDGDIVPLTSGFGSIPDSSVRAVITRKSGTGGTYYVLTVTATASGETYIKTTEYTGNAASGYSKR